MHLPDAVGPRLDCWPPDSSRGPPSNLRSSLHRHAHRIEATMRRHAHDAVRRYRQPCNRDCISAGPVGPAPPPMIRAERMTLPMNGTSRIVSLPRASYSAARKPRGGSQDCLRKCAAGAAAQPPLGLNADGTTACSARRGERSGSAIGTPFGASGSHPTQIADQGKTTGVTSRRRTCYDPEMGIFAYSPQNYGRRHNGHEMIVVW